MHNMLVAGVSPEPNHETTSVLVRPSAPTLSVVAAPLVKFESPSVGTVLAYLDGSAGNVAAPKAPEGTDGEILCPISVQQYKDGTRCFTRQLSE